METAYFLVKKKKKTDNSDQRKNNGNKGKIFFKSAISDRQIGGNIGQVNAN